MEKILAGVVIFVGLLGLIFVLSLLFAWPTLWIVNYLIAPSALVAVFGISQLTFWKAFFLNFICASLFKSSCTGNSK